MNTIWFPDLSATTRPKYQVLIEAIRNAVQSGDLVVGERLPPVRELGWQLKVTPGTVARAYTKLTDEGMLQAAVGRGTFVADTKARARLPVAGKSKLTGTKPEQIDLQKVALPDVGQQALIQRCYGDMAKAGNANLLNYPTLASKQALRLAATKWLSGAQLGNFQPEDIALTNGGQNAVMLVLQSILKDPDPVVFVEDLSYSGFRHAAQLLRAKVVGLKSDEFGVRPDELEAACRSYGAQVFCTSPEVNNPTVMRTGLARRQELAEIARSYECQVLEDACYRIAGSDLPSYRALLPDLGWYVTSISKSISPALRVGFALAPQNNTPKLLRVACYNYFGISIPVCDLSQRLLNAPEIDQISQDVRDTINCYIRAAVNVLGRFDLQWHEDVPFLWLRLPRGWRAGAFCMAAEKRGVLLRSADDFALIDGRAPHAVRISVNGQIALQHFEEAISVLEQLLSDPPDSLEA
ncbi:MAG TPA: PLP-dependent aminotransferase family protein [Rhodobacteraceae bacterium]|jgi:DNA-binding transcriptional MocR family regulator|nr:PLP-dependent aminotransferase family protein [Paracoccaceae bacterium]